MSFISQQFVTTTIRVTTTTVATITIITITIITCYLFQRISVSIQRFNATLLHESFSDENRLDD